VGEEEEGEQEEADLEIFIDRGESTDHPFTCSLSCLRLGQMFAANANFLFGRNCSCFCRLRDFLGSQAPGSRTISSVGDNVQRNRAAMKGGSVGVRCKVRGPKPRDDDIHQRVSGTKHILFPQNLEKTYAY
jgi:hypothetical protein